ncbi:hypothetical protein OnM2_039091 [Erysiphe neolycopersici]|uniref:Uncharacterized protein n=1 Tax=Erysiphe neolycopersici TaxID=212602 RepID=A0A420HWH6_9PEZI|nr:hypothetical protein OnM2_039091 [Erysiphe neolycopersici]
MLLRLLITFVVLTINVGNVFAEGESSGADQNKESRFSKLRISRPNFMKNQKSRTEGTKFNKPGNYRVYCLGRIYEKQEITNTLANICKINPTTGQASISQMAIPYEPKNKKNIPAGALFYLWPTGRGPKTSYSKPSNFHRILFDNKCEVKDVLMQLPKFGKIVSMARKEFRIYDRKDYFYKSCWIKYDNK